MVEYDSSEGAIRTQSAPANFAIANHAASNIRRISEGKQRFQLKRHIAAWDANSLHKGIPR